MTLDRRNILFGAASAGLVGLPNGDTLVGGHRHAAATLAALRAASPSARVMIHDGALFRWTAADFSRTPLGPANDVTVVKQDQTPVSEGAWLRQSGPLSVTDFGAVPGKGGSARDNSLAFRSAIETAAALGMPLALGGGFYRLEADGGASGGVNFARPGLAVQGGGATLAFSGGGRAFIVDQGGPDGGFVEGITVTDVVIVGGAEVTDGFYSRGVVRSSFQNIEVRLVSDKAFHLKHAVSNSYDGLKYSPQEADRPLAKYGLYIDNNGPGFYSTNCVFINTVLEDFPGVGCTLVDANGLQFLGGTFEACAIGLVTSVRSTDNLFSKVWMEANARSDAVVSGNGNGFIGGKFLSASMEPNVRVLPGASGTWFSGGGYLRSVYLAAGSTETVFHQIGVDENRSGTIGFQGPGPFTRSGCKKIGPTGNVVGFYPDVIGPVQALGDNGSWTPVLKSRRSGTARNGHSATGIWHKIGSLVFVQCAIIVDRLWADGDMIIEGLPFPATSASSGAVHDAGPPSNGAGDGQLLIAAGGRTLLLSRAGGGGNAAPSDETRRTLTLSITYTTAV